MFSIDSLSRIPVYEQIINQVEKYVSVGLLKPGEQLPSVRSLSVDLSVNPNTIQKAFGELLSSGITVSVPGKGSFISNEAVSIINNRNIEKISDFSLLARKLLRAGVTADELKQLIDKEAEDNGENISGGDKQ